jgi:hypothetical protein
MLIDKAPKELTEVQLAFIQKAEKKLGPIATRTQLKAFHKTARHRAASPYFVTKNKAFKTEIRGAYNLAIIHGKAAANKAFRSFSKEREVAKAAPMKAVASAKGRTRSARRAA